jgi:hypothetical protein
LFNNYRIYLNKGESLIVESNSIENLHAVGIDNIKARPLAEKLNELFSNYSVFYPNTRGYHCNMKGEKFLHFILNLKSYTMTY